jgi:Family of unknown function (DUF6498)
MNAVNDSSIKAQGSIAAGPSPRTLLHPSTLLLLAGNSLPIYGVLHWGWDVFVLLVLYWLETAVIGIWMIVSIVAMPIEALGKVEINGKPAKIKMAAARAFIVAFFLVHAGIFMLVHFIFLWTLFSGDWVRRIHGPADFFSKLIFGTDLWIPLLVLFVVRGFGFMFRTLRPEFVQRIEAQLGLRPVKPPAADFGQTVGSFYSRVIVMHLTILASGFVAFALGTITPLVIMVLIKTFADVALQWKFDFGQTARITRAYETATSK